MTKSATTPPLASTDDVRTFAVRPTLESALSLFVAEYGHGGLALDCDRFAAYLHAGFAITESKAAAREGGSTLRGGIAVLSLQGVLIPKGRETWFGRMPGMDMFRAQLAAAAGNPDISAIVLDVDSPGGTAMGTPETAAAVVEARAVKPVVAVVSGLMASAAYWIGSQATEIVATPSAVIGSIGVRMMHADYSRQLERVGISVTSIAAGKYKNELSPFAPLSDEAKAYLQEQVDATHETFIADVAAGRGVSKAEVRNGFGQGRVLDARPALNAKMIDRIASVDAVIAQLASGKGRAWRKRSALPFL